MLLFFQALSTKGWQGCSLPDTHCRGKTSFSTRLDRYGKIVLPWAVFLGQSMIGGTCFEHPLYKDPTPQEFLQEGECENVVRWIGLGGHPS